MFLVSVVILTLVPLVVPGRGKVILAHGPGRGVFENKLLMKRINNTRHRVVSAETIMMEYRVFL
jgi:phospholipid N-methyltransferase